MLDAILNGFNFGGYKAFIDAKTIFTHI